MKKAQTNGMVIILMVVIIAMVAISVAWGLIRSQQDTTSIVDDVFTVSNTSCVRIVDTCYTPNTLVVTNATDGAGATGNFTECGAGVIPYGAIGVVDWDYATGDTANATYTQQACQRLTGLTGTIIDYVPVLMAVLILVFVAGFSIK